MGDVDVLLVMVIVVEVYILFVFCIGFWWGFVFFSIRYMKYK